MKVILTEKVNTLGTIGEVVNVSDGYARNFLFPRKLAVLCDEAHKKVLDNQKKALAKKVLAETTAAKAIKAKIDGVEIALVRKVGSNGRLFGTITNTELAKELLGKGIEIERRLLVIEDPIKALGTFSVKAKIFTGIEAAFNVKVTIDPEQAEEMKKRQVAAEKRAKEKKKKVAEEGEAAPVEATEATEE